MPSHYPCMMHATYPAGPAISDQKVRVLVQPGCASAPFMAAESASLGTNSMNAVDTNVLIYSLDDTERRKQAKAQALIARLVQPPVETVLPWQVAGELLSCLRKWESAGCL